MFENNIHGLIDNYNAELGKYVREGATVHPKDFVDLNPEIGSWTRSIYNAFLARKTKEFDDSCIYEGIYRPYCKQYLYFSKSINECCYKMDRIFPTPNSENRIIVVPGGGARKTFSAYITDKIPSLDIIEKAICFPLYTYEMKKLDQMDLFYDGTVNYQKYDGISDFIYEEAIKRYGEKVTKEDIFYYVYGLLNERTYANKFDADLKQMLPRLPLLKDINAFWIFSRAGRELANLHIDYENVPAYKDVIISGDKGNYEISKMRYKDKLLKDVIIYNEDITISNIPSRAYDYKLDGKSAIDWIVDRYEMTNNKKTQICNNPNLWKETHGNPRYILDLLLSIINVSIKTMDIVDSLPTIDWDNE